MAIGRAIKAVDRDIIYVALYGSQMQKAAEKLGLPMALEGFPDRRYPTTATSPRARIPDTVLKDPKQAAEQARSHGARRRDRGAQRQAHQGQGAYAVRARRRGDAAWSWRAASARRWRRPASPWCRCPT